jgi:hypothetical protein
MATAASKGPTTPTAGPAGELAPTVRKRRPTGGWTMMVPVGARTATVAAKEPTAFTAGPVGALAPAVKKGGLAEGWGHAAVPMAAMAPSTLAKRSREATAAAWTMAMAAARSPGVTLTVAEATATMLMAGGVALSKSRKSEPNRI